MTNSGITAEPIGAPAPVSASFRWEAPDKPPSILLSLDVIDRLERAVIDAFKAITSRGSEIGGLLLGRIVAGGKRTVFIEDYVPVDCGYSRGPLYLLAEDDKRRLEEAIANAKNSATLSVVGFFRSNTRRDVAMDEDDQSIASDYFADPNHVFLLVKPLSMKPSTAGFFIWEDGRIQGEASYSPFPFKRAELMKVFADSIVQAGSGKASAAEPAAPVVMPVREERPAPQPISFKREEPVVAPQPVEPPRPAPVFFKREDAATTRPIPSYMREEAKPAAPPVVPPPPPRPEPVPPRPSPLSFRRDESKPTAVPPPPPVRPEPVPPRPSPISFRREESRPSAPPLVTPPPPVRPEPPRVAPVAFRREESRPPAAPPVETRPERPPAPPISFKREERPAPPPVVNREQPPAPPREEKPAVVPAAPRVAEPPKVVPAPSRAAEPPKVVPVAPKKEDRPAVQPTARKEEPAKREEPVPVQAVPQKVEQPPAVQPAPPRKERPAAAAVAPAPKVEATPVAVTTGSLFAESAPEPAGSGKTKMIIAIAALVLIVLVGGYFAFRPSAPATPAVTAADSDGLGLKVDKNGASGQLLLTWKRDSEFIATARSATLTIQDGDRKEPVSLDLGQLRYGSIAYTPDSNDVSFRLEVVGKAKTLSESMRYLTGRPSAAGPLTAAAGQQPRKAEGPDKPPQTNQIPAVANAGNQPAYVQPPQLTTLPPQPGSLAGRLSAAPPIEAPSLGSSSNVLPSGPIPSLGGSQALPGAPKAPPAPASSGSAAPQRVSAVQQEGKVLRRYQPVYPTSAKMAHISGVVRLEAVIGKDGKVKKVSVRGGPALLQAAAVDAVQRWVYQPTVLNGQPIEVITDIDVNFNFNR